MMKSALVWIGIIVLVLLALKQIPQSSKVNEIAFSTFYTEGVEGKYRSVTLTGMDVEGTYKTPVKGPKAAPRKAHRVGWPAVTEGEWRVVALAAQGHTNAEIAARLFLSRYTVETHLKHVFAKLGLRSRAELAAIAAAAENKPPNT